MTTAYTATVDITTPSVILTDFTCVVPANIGVNVYGAALNTDINTFDIGPTGGTNLLLQTLAVGSHHIHDGVCHDSATGTIPPDSGLGVHGIYDKAAGTLVENMEFYNHPHGQACSVRYGNAYKSNLYHDTPYSLAAFNYQGAALGPAGTPRFRDCIFYNLPAGGYVFYSDGLWRESNGTLLGNSLFSIEIDHCTIDIRGMTNPFDFSQCHNDVYLTNCVIISDSGLPLSSIITPPLDSSTVHLDGSIVLSSADAATYLGPAPTFTPIAVGGSPVIGTAVASPPVSFAQWGNTGDLGATQTGSTPPGPPPLPGPGTPTLTVFEAGSVTDSGSDTVVIPITVDVPRSSPSSATIILIFYQAIPSMSGGDTVIAAVDDTTPQDAYSLCIFEDGLNHYNAAPAPVMGLVVNDLVGGVNNITVTLNGPPSIGHYSAVAVTGIAFEGSGPLDPTLPGIVALLQETEYPVGGGTSVGSFGAGWNYGNFGAVSMTEPLGATDAGWDFVSGQLAFFHMGGQSAASLGGWTWMDGSLVPFVDWEITDGSEFYFSFLALLNPMTPGVAAPTVVGTPGAGWPQFGLGGTAIALAAGLGPICTAPSPPGSGTPVFNNHIRLSE